MTYPDAIPATPAPFLSDILRRGLQMDPRRTGSNAQAHLAHTRRTLSPSSAHPPPLLEHGELGRSRADGPPRPAPPARNPTPRPAGPPPAGHPLTHEPHR